jgi:hypothetical protein
MPSSVRLAEVLENLADCAFFDVGDVVSFIPGRCIIRVVDRNEICPEQRRRVVLSNELQKSLIQTLFDIFVALQSSQIAVNLGTAATRTDCLPYEILLSEFVNIFGFKLVVN